MKHHLSILGSIVGPIVLLSIQLCLIKYEHTILLNCILTAYIYAVFAEINSAIIGILILMLDIVHFLITGYFGFITILATALTLIIVKIKANFYNKLILPAICITSYYIAEYFILRCIMNKQVYMVDYISACIINTICFIFIWWITKQPMHD